VKKINSNFPGVRYSEHQTRRHGKKPDRYFFIRYYIAKKRTEQGLGWASEGWTEKRAYDLLCEFKSNAKTGAGACTVAEKQAEKRQQISEKISFQKFVVEHYLPFARTNQAPGTHRAELSLLQKWILPVLANIPLETTSFSHIETVKQKMIAAGRSPRSVQYAVAVIRQIINHGRDTDFFSGENPVSKIKLSLADNQRIRFLSREEAEQLLKTLRDSSSQLHDIALISLYCGLRAGEIFALTWDCIDFLQGTIIIKDPKNRRNRYAYPPPRVLDMLRTLPRHPETNLVFVSRSGQIITEVSNSFQRVVDRMGLNKGIKDRRNRLVFHSLRHTFASWLAEAGTDLYTIKELMGHSSIKMTERYAHLSPNKMREAMKALES
jgi:integrase